MTAYRIIDDVIMAHGIVTALRGMAHGFAKAHRRVAAPPPKAPTSTRVSIFDAEDALRALTSAKHMDIRMSPVSLLTFIDLEWACGCVFDTAIGKLELACSYLSPAESVAMVILEMEKRHERDCPKAVKP